MSSDRRAEAATRRLDVEQAGRREAWADPYAAGPAASLRFERTGMRVESGVVVDAVPGGHVYLVSAGRESFVWCSPTGPGGGFGVLGARPLATYPIWTCVTFVRHHDDPSAGFILGALPSWSSHHANRPADGIWPFVRTGYPVESVHRTIGRRSSEASAAYQVQTGPGEVSDYSAGRPYESTTVGEWGFMSETGVGLFADPFQAYLRADEATGVFASYVDQHLRVAGHNLQMFSSVWESEDLEDEGELRKCEALCVYPWEPYGLWRYNQVTPGWALPAVANNGLAAGQGVKLNDPYDVLAGSGSAVREPEEPTQMPAARKYRWDGYLGQGGASVVAAPAQLDWAYPSQYAAGARAATVSYATPTTAPGGRLSVNGSAGPSTQPKAVPVNKRGGPDQPGLFASHNTVAGDWHVRSAGEIFIGRRCSIPVPRPVCRPEDPAGDRPATYDASGKDGTHKVTAELTRPAGVPSAAALPDSLAYAFNWKDLHPFAYHALDWSAAEEGAAGSAIANQDVPEFGDLALQQFLDAPTPTFLDVDHRYGLSPFYEDESGVAFLRDGDVVLYGGGGCEIRMSRGAITMSAPGDVTLLPGRNLVAWAGHDVDVKAHDTVDLAAVNGDVFVRAEYKMHAVSGNGGCGGFLFENKSVCPAFAFAGKTGADTVSSGFTVLCQDSAFIVRAQEISLSLTGTDAGQDARIYLDAGDGRNVFTRSKVVTHSLSPDGSVLHLFDGGAHPAVNEFAQDYTMLDSGDLLVAGKGYFADCLSSASWITAGDHFASARRGEFGGLVASASPDSASADNAIQARVEALTVDYADDFGSQLLLPPNAEDAEFTHRTAVQYRSTDYVHWESRWQSMAAAAGQVLWTWTEPSVIGSVSSVETYAHPGERRLEVGSYASIDPILVDDSAGWVAVGRTSSRTLYEAGSAGTLTDSDLDSAYKITTPAG